MKDLRNAYRILFRKCSGKRPLGRPKGSWEDNINLDFEIV